jgi:hypothetical protein
MTQPPGRPSQAQRGAEAADRPTAARRDEANTELTAALKEAASAEEAAQLAGLLPPNALRLPRWFTVATALCAVLFVPWIVYLAVELPEKADTGHYDVMWVGFDIGMWAVLVGLAVAAWRHSTWTEPLAVCAATFLCLDAWFDVVSADSTPRLVSAVLSAVLLELPAAAVCAWIARHAELIRRRAYGQLFRWAADQWRIERMRRRNRPSPTAD